MKEKKNRDYLIVEGRLCFKMDEDDDRSRVMHYCKIIIKMKCNLHLVA